MLLTHRNLGQDIAYLGRGFTVRKVTQETPPHATLFASAERATEAVKRYREKDTPRAKRLRQFFLTPVRVTDIDRGLAQQLITPKMFARHGHHNKLPPREKQ